MKFLSTQQSLNKQSVLPFPVSALRPRMADHHHTGSACRHHFHATTHRIILVLDTLLRILQGDNKQLTPLVASYLRLLNQRNSRDECLDRRRILALIKFQIIIIIYKIQNQFNHPSSKLPIEASWTALVIALLDTIRFFSNAS